MKYISLIVLIIIFSSCKKPEPVADPTNEDLTNSMLVLCEGLFQHNNSSITWVDFSNEAEHHNFFESQAQRTLGDTGNDLKRYGGKIYVVVNVSSTVEVMDANTFKPIAQIPMFENGQAKQPRSLAFSGGNAYVTCYDGFVDVIDTLSLSVTQRIPVGENPEGLAVSNGKLYVANSGGLNFPNVDSTVSVIDLSQNIEITKITVGNNPGGVLVNSSGAVFVIARGDYGAIPSRLKKIDPTTDQVIDAYGFNISGMSPMDNDNMLIFNAAGVSKFNFLSNGIAQQNFIDIGDVYTLYNVVYRPSDDHFYIMDAMNYTNLGFVRKYNSSGAFVKSYQVGLNPSKIIFYD